MSTAKKRVPKIASQKDQGARYMPIRLKRVLAQNNVTQSDWAAALCQTAGSGKGRGLSEPAASLLLNWGQWPKSTPADELMKQTESFLRSRGVTEFEIKNIWSELPDEDQKHYERAHTTPPVIGAPIYIDDQLPEMEMLSPAAKKHFGMFKDPFKDEVQKPDDVFLDADQRYIREAMYQTAKHGGFLAVVGESGAGKTTLRRDLVDRVNREGNDVVVIQPRIIDKTKLSAGQICDAIICDISSEAPKRSLEAKARQIETLLKNASRGGASHVLMIEEAHDLNIQTLKYLKRFWELEDGFRKLLAIILVGQLELKNKLDERQNFEAREVIRRCEVAELPPLSSNLERYLELKFRRINKTLAEVFEPNAFDAIRKRLTIHRNGGQAINMMYPLIVNTTVTKALNLAASLGAMKIDADIIKEV